MNNSDNNNKESNIYKSIVSGSRKTGNIELDNGLALIKFNSIPNFVKEFAQGVRF